MFSPLCFPNFVHEFFSVWKNKEWSKKQVFSQFASWKRNHNKYLFKKFVDCVEIRPNLSKLVQTCSNWSKFDETNTFFFSFFRRSSDCHHIWQCCWEKEKDPDYFSCCFPRCGRKPTWTKCSGEHHTISGTFKLVEIGLNLSKLF